MKIIQSYIPYKNPYKIDMDKDYLYSMMLSAVLLHKNFEKPTLYTNEKQKSFLERFHFPYEYDTSVLKNEKADVFAFTKLNSILSQESEFIHFDLDTFVFKPFNLDKYKTNFLFSHNDINFLVKELEKHETIEEQIGSQSYSYIYKTYLKFYIDNRDNLEKNPYFLTEYLRLSEIPNMNIICVRNGGVPIIKEAIQNSYKVYQDIKKDIDKEWIGSAFIEQLTVPLHIKKLSESYEKNITNSVLFGDSPLFPKYTKDNIVIFEGNEYCSECGMTHQTEVQVNLLKDNLSKLKYFHSGGNKHDKYIKYLVLKTLIELTDLDSVMEMSYTFDKFCMENNQKPKLSESELMYNQYTNSTIFTIEKNKTLF